MLNEEIRDEKVAPDSLAMWWLGTTGIWVKTPGEANISFDFWAGTGRTSHKKWSAGIAENHQMSRMTGGREEPPNLKSYPMVIDPFSVGKINPIDAFFVTHIHGDHICPYTAAAVLQNSEAPLIGPQVCVDFWREWGVPEDRCVVIKPGENYKVKDTVVHAVESFDRTVLLTTPPDGDLRNKMPLDMDERSVNYVIETPGGTVYHSGDSHFSTGYGKHGKQFDIDLCLVSYGENAPGNMDKVPASDCLRIAENLRSKVLIPFHWDTWSNQLPDMHEIATLYKFNKHKYDFNLFCWKTGGKYLYPQDKEKMWYSFPQGQEDIFENEPNVPFPCFL